MKLFNKLKYDFIKDKFTNVVNKVISEIFTIDTPYEDEVYLSLDIHVYSKFNSNTESFEDLDIDIIDYQYFDECGINLVLTHDEIKELKKTITNKIKTFR